MLMKDNYLFIPLTYIAIGLFILAIGWECRHLFNISGGMFLGIALGEWLLRRSERKKEEKLRKIEHEYRLQAIRAQYGCWNPVGDGKDEPTREGKDNVLRPNSDGVVQER